VLGAFIVRANAQTAFPGRFAGFDQNADGKLAREE
jgi:hypothetical protein